MAKPLNSGYVGRRMSRRAYEAEQRGECTLPMLTQRKLERHGIHHSLNFVRWLCRRGYIRPCGEHHKGNPPHLARYYHPRHIARQMENLAIGLLLDEWKSTWKGSSNRGGTMKIIRKGINPPVLPPKSVTCPHCQAVFMYSSWTAIKSMYLVPDDYDNTSPDLPEGAILVEHVKCPFCKMGITLLDGKPQDGGKQ